MAYLDTSTTGHTLDAEFDLLGLVVERAAALDEGDALERVVAHHGGEGRLENIKDSGEGSLESVGKGHYAGTMGAFRLREGERTNGK